MNRGCLKYLLNKQNILSWTVLCGQIKTICVFHNSAEQTQKKHKVIRSENKSHHHNYISTVQKPTFKNNFFKNLIFLHFGIFWVTKVLLEGLFTLNLLQSHVTKSNNLSWIIMEKSELHSSNAAHLKLTGLAATPPPLNGIEHSLERLIWSKAMYAVMQSASTSHR